MKKLLSAILLLIWSATLADAQLVPRQTVEPGSGLVFCTSTDGTDTYTCPNATPIITAYALNMPVLLTVATSNIGSATLSIRGITPAVTILAHDGSPLVNSSIVAGRPYLLIYNGTNFLLYAVGSAGGGGGSGITASANRILKALSGSTAGDSNCLDDGTSIACGNIAGAYHEEQFDTPTESPHVHTWPAATGKIAQTTGVLSNGNCAKYDASGRLVDQGGKCGVTIKNITILDPTTAETNKVQIQFAQAVTLAKIGCSTDTGTATIQFDKRTETTPNAIGTDVLPSSLVCDSDRQETTAFSSAGVTTSQVLNLRIITVASSPTVLRIHILAAPD